MGSGFEGLKRGVGQTYFSKTGEKWQEKNRPLPGAAFLSAKFAADRVLMLSKPGKPTLSQNLQGLHLTLGNPF